MAAPDRRIWAWQSSWRCLVHSARQGFATTASTLTSPVFEYRHHQSSSAIAGPKLHEHEFLAAFEARITRNPLSRPRAGVELSPLLLLAGEGLEGYRRDKRLSATTKRIE